ncbi:hypothetical protein BGX34_010030 [Mortierella sp. NVP85]|nr:hypothetical protein BGX34_010030 [Mortierella sp. NVP85]
MIGIMQQYVDQRVKDRKPLQYILGSQPFMDLEILTRPPVLIPRWETEEWTIRLAALLKNEHQLFQHQDRSSPSSQKVSSPLSTASSARCRKPPMFNILDICTGTGCIALGLASALPGGSCNILGVDINPDAVQLATENRVRNHALLNSNMIQFQQGNVFDPTAGHTFQGWLKSEADDYDTLDHVDPGRSPFPPASYQLVVANPPYIAHSEFKTLEPEVAQWEDTKALLADHDGLVFYPRIADVAMELLHHNNYCYRTSSRQTTLSGNERNVAPNGKGLSSSAELGASRKWRNGPDLDKVKVPELVLEIGGDHQVEFVAGAVRQAGFGRVEVWKDLADRARCIVSAR